MAPPTLPKGLPPGTEVWALTYRNAAWLPSLVGRVKRATASGYEVAGNGGVMMGLSQCPLFVTREAAETWARENPPKMPTAPGT